ncbi:MAG: homoserine dehydrogenase [Nitrospirae bacterium]|uniref:homoserine dehydrogenase n=1 Tax=Candidatus Magnetobacterium casense TaxID=1455061 RepID=UPI00058B35BA|nr:homoserine dehydrogenase [Candidatus Magnetobacterium casensis]MBF0338540.1 homoserine dehydrogenase [Nitrospirota bacterium]
MTNVGIIGFGTVGSGTARILLQQGELIKKRTGIDIKLKKIADLDIKRDRGVNIPPGVLTTDAYEIINDPEIDVVVELVGGFKPAKTFILDAIKQGKHVVTANKALLAQEGHEIFAEALKHNKTVAFEAAVAGGIPIIKVLREGLAANNISAIYGIINGTSNYILTKMTREGISFEDALKEAQALGYAEANPSFDIEGIDTAHKLTLLSCLAYGIELSYGKVYKEGITAITPLDIQFATELGYKIKLLAIAKNIDGEIELRVHPTMIPEDYLISQVDDVLNAVYVIGDAVGETMYYGRGAGDMPTGSAVVSDIIDIAKGYSHTLRQDNSSSLKIKDIRDVYSMYYFRFTALDKPGVLSKISGVLGDHDISISAVIQKERRAGEAIPLVVLTHKARERDVLDAVAKIDILPVVADITKFIRVEGKE